MITFEGYLKLTPSIPLIDVRSPDEYQKGHIPGAVNIPLFTDEERAVVGTTYKQVSKEKAIEVGYAYVLPKLQEFIDRSRQVAPDGKVIVHCWRGGMRSQAFAKHLSDNGFSAVNTIDGGYKSFRSYVLHEFYKNYKLLILGGYTGSSKTLILRQLKKSGHQVVDLEALAKHKGSAFGMTDELQPTVEQFENNLFWEWKDLNRSQPIWLEDESHNIGTVKIPMGLFHNMRFADVYFLEISKELRARQLVIDYASIPKQKLASSILRISSKLGDLNTRLALEHLENDNFYEVAMLVLNYYDKSYRRGLEKRDPHTIHRVPAATNDPEKNTRILLKYLTTHSHG